jgi:hypothetical protein
MKLEYLLKASKIGKNYFSINLIENLSDCRRINVMYRVEVFDADKFRNWCSVNKIEYGKVEYNDELVYRLDRFN